MQGSPIRDTITTVTTRQGLNRNNGRKSRRTALHVHPPRYIKSYLSVLEMIFLKIAHIFSIGPEQDEDNQIFLVLADEGSGGGGGRSKTNG